MKVFISGPMSGKPNYNRAAFFKAEEELEKHGYSVWNPAWLAYPSDTEFTKDDMHIIDFAALRRCDAIYMLKGWKHSKGAQKECEYAIMRGLMIMYEGAHCWGNEPVFDQEFAYDEAIKNRTNYQLEAIKENVKEKYNTLDRRIKSIEEELAWDKWKNDLPDNFCSNRIDSLEKWRNDFTECYTVNITNLRKEVEAIKESIGTDNLKEQLDKDFDDVYTEFQNTKDQFNDIEFGYIDWSSKMSSAIDEMEKVKKTVKGLNSLVATLGERNGVLSDDIYELQRVIISSDIENISIKAMNQKLIDLGREYKEADEVLDKCIKAINHRMSDLGSELDEYIDDYKEAYKHLDNADEALERRIKALEKKSDDCTKRMNNFSRELDKFNTAIDILVKDNGSIAKKHSDDNKVVNNTLTDFNIRLKAIENRLNIKPFYAPTEDEKDD